MIKRFLNWLKRFLSGDPCPNCKVGHLERLPDGKRCTYCHKTFGNEE